MATDSLLPTTLNLTLPRSWNQCSVQQLETIARIMVVQGRKSTPYHPYSILDVKVELFFALTGLTMVLIDGDDILALHGSDRVGLKVWQVLGWMDTNMKWIDDATMPGLTRFPYDELRLGLWRRHFRGPGALMQDFSWQRYRYAQDYHDYYCTLHNQWITMSAHPKRHAKAALEAKAKELDLAKSRFLATLFCRRVPQVDSRTAQRSRDYAFVPGQSEANAHYFCRFDEIRFQVILFWWEGMVRYLQEKYPRCFRRQKVKGGTPQPNALEVYTRMTATMEKYLGLTEEMVNAQLFHVNLQHLDDMMRESEELKKTK